MEKRNAFPLEKSPVLPGGYLCSGLLPTTWLYAREAYGHRIANHSHSAKSSVSPCNFCTGRSIYPLALLKYHIGDLDT